MIWKWCGVQVRNRGDSFLHIPRDIDVDIEDENGEFSIKARFPDIVPVTEETEPERAKRIYENLNSSMHSRFDVFCRVLNMIARAEKIDYWKELDVGFTSLVMLLEEKGLDGAIECLKPAIERATGVERGSSTDH